MEISKAAREKAHELFEAGQGGVHGFTRAMEVFARYIQQVSDVARLSSGALADLDCSEFHYAREALQPLILSDEPDPRKVDAMLEARRKCGLVGQDVASPLTDEFETALAKRGGRIVFDD